MARVRGVSASTELAKKAGSGKFLTLKDGDAVRGCFLGVIKHGLEGDSAEPLGVEVVWLEGRNGRHSVEYDPNVHSEDDMRVQFAWNFLVVGEAEDGSEDQVRIFQQGPRFYDDWLRHKDKEGGYNRWFTIGREGAGQFDTKYYIDREEAISEDELTDLQGYDLHDLNKELFRNDNEEGKKRQQPNRRKPRQRRTRATDAPRTTSSSSGDNGSSANGGNGIISDAVATELRQAIKGMPNAAESMMNFKEKFSVDKLKNLPSDKEGEARAWLSAIGTAQTEPKPSGSGEVDPFE